MRLFFFACTVAGIATLSLSSGAALAQKRQPTPKAPAVASAAAPTAPASPVVAESLSGLDLIPNRRTGTFGIRINHRISQPATLRLIDTQTSRFIKTELLEPSAARTRAVQVGRLTPGEYKMEVVMTDTTYWKTVRVSK
jgi:hypothetical protein